MVTEDSRDVIRRTLYETKAKVGLSWNSESGKRTIVRIQLHPSTGKEVMFISTEDKPSLEILPVGELDWELKSAASKLTSIAKARSSKEQEDKEKAERDSWLGFTDKLRGAARDRVLKVLSKTMRVHGKLDMRGEHIRRLVRERGYKVIDSTFKTIKGRILTGPDESFFTEKDLTKIGLDFAKYLSK